MIVSVGWADPAYLSLLVLSQQRKIPLVVVSDSCREDSDRSPLKEWLKRQLLRGYTGLGAGSRVETTSCSLGLRQRRSISLGMWLTTVDRPISCSGRISRSSTDERPFLCVGRLIPEKNHALLLQAFTHYQLQGGTRDLLLVGHGPLEDLSGRVCQASTSRFSELDPLLSLSSWLVITAKPMR